MGSGKLHFAGTKPVCKANGDAPFPWMPGAVPGKRDIGDFDLFAPGVAGSLM